jgi:hypothetical protein
MNKLLVILFLSFIAIASQFINIQSIGIVSSDSSPMGIGEAENYPSWSKWNNDRLADPATGQIPAGIREAEMAFASTLPKNYSRAYSWQQVGPKQLGGRTRAASFDIRNENIVIAGGVSGGLWKSVNGMASYYKTTTSSQIHSVTSVAQDKRTGKEDVWYAGTGEYYPVTSASAYNSPFSGDGIFKSTDNGNTWTLLPSTQSLTPHTSYANGDMDYVWRVVTDHTDTINDVVLAAVYNGIFRTADGGSTWIPVLGIDSAFTTTSDYVDLIITPSGKFYAAMSSDGPHKGVYRSADGINWTNILPSTGFPSTYDRIVMAYNPLNENEIMMVGETPSAGLNSHSLFKYTYLSGDGTDTGGVWENRSLNLPNDSCVSPSGFNFATFQTQGGYDVFIAYHPTIPSMILLGGTNVYRSTDEFSSNTNTTWIGGYKCNTADYSDYVYDNHHPDQHGMIFYPSDPNKALSFNDGGLFVSNDISAPAVTWTSKNNGYITSQFYTVTQEQGDVSNDFLVGGSQDNGTWFTNANHLDSLWKWVASGDGAYAQIPEGRPYYLLSSQQGRMYKVGINNVGDTTAPTRVDPNKSKTINFINPFIIDPNNNARVYMVQNYRLFRNDIMDIIPQDGNKVDTMATGWINLGPSTVSSLTYGYISCVEMSKASPNTVYYGTSLGKVLKLYNSNSSTCAKQNITSTLFPVNAYVSSISVNPFDSTQIMVTFANYKVKSVFYSSDAGVSWTDVSGNLEQFPDGTGAGPAVFWCELYPTIPGPIFFVGTSTGLYSTDYLNGTSTVWTQEGPTTLGNINVNMMEARTFDGKMVVATHGAGFYTTYLPPTSLGQQEANQELYASVYPNPVISNLNIEFVPQADEITNVFIHNLSGQRVYAKKMKLQPGQKSQQQIPVNEFSSAGSGTFIVSIVNGKMKKSFKIIVKK